MVLAGHETTGTALAWALESLLRRPEVVHRIRAELAQVAGEGALPGAREQLARLEYLDAVIKEVLRFRPIMAFGGHAGPPGAMARRRVGDPRGRRAWRTR